MLLHTKCLAKASNRVAFLLSFIAAISSLISSSVLSLPNRPGRTASLALLLLVKGWSVLSVKYSKTAQHLFCLRYRTSIILKISRWCLLLYTTIKSINISKCENTYLPLNIDLPFLSAKVSDLKLTMPLA